MNEELAKAVAALREPWLITENRASVVVYRDDLTAVLDRLEELEEVVKAVPDTTSKLEVGDKVETLISYRMLDKGSVGIVKKINLTDEYPFDIKFEGKADITGYKRDELSKVSL